MRTIGLLHSGHEDSFIEQVKELIGGLGQMNYWAGQADVPDGYEEVTIVKKWAKDSDKKLQNLADELAKDKDVEVIVAAGGPKSALCAQKSTTKNQKPVVFTTVVDPVRLGLVETLAKPGTNLTGMAGKTSETDDSRLIILTQLLPEATKIGVAIKDGRPLRKEVFEVLEDSAEALNVSIEQWLTPAGPLKAARPKGHLGLEIFGKKDAGDVNAVLVTADSFFNNNRKTVVDVLNFFNLPAIYQWREFADLGGLISYGPSIAEAYSSAGVYVGRILSGQSVGQIPVSEPTRKELVINLKTAKRLNITVPEPLRKRAILIPE